MSPHCDDLDGIEDNTLIFALDTRAYDDTTPYICSQKDKLFRRYLDKHADRRTSGPLIYYTPTPILYFLTAGRGSNQTDAVSVHQVR